MTFINNIYFLNKQITISKEQKIILCEMHFHIVKKKTLIHIAINEKSEQIL